MKCPLSLIAKMLPALEEVAWLSHFGNQEKYSPDSWLLWETSEEAEAFMNKRADSLARHVMLALENPLSTDEESKKHHLAATAWNALAMLTLIHEYDLHNLELIEDDDDEPNEERKKLFRGYREQCEEMESNRISKDKEHAERYDKIIQLTDKLSDCDPDSFSEYIKYRLKQTEYDEFMALYREICNTTNMFYEIRKTFGIHCFEQEPRMRGN